MNFCEFYIGHSYPGHILRSLVDVGQGVRVPRTGLRSTHIYAYRGHDVQQCMRLSSMRVLVGLTNIRLSDAGLAGAKLTVIRLTDIELSDVGLW